MASIKIVAILSFGIFLFPSVLGSSSSWYYLTFSQDWPQTRCIEQTEKKEHHCVIPKYVNSWIIHGVWPSYQGEHKGPEHCKTSNPFDPKEIAHLVPQLNVTWPNLFVDSKLYSFWDHEWETHGRCATSLPALANEYKYFLRGLELSKQFSIHDILKVGAILPSNDKPYKMSDILSVLQQHLHVKVDAECFYDKPEGKLYLGEIQICLSKEFDPIDCPSDDHVLRYEPCSGSAEVWYPLITRQTK